MLKVLGTLRPSFLVLTPACLLLAWSVANDCCAPVESRLIMLAVVGALAAHISVNAFNEFFDFRSGLDACTQRTPFSGGSGTLVAAPELAPQTLRIAIASLLLVCICGSVLIWLQGLQLLLPIGLAGLLLITLYTTHIVRQPLLCLLAAGSGFGPVMIAGTVVALTGQLPSMAIWVALIMFFVINNLLLLNQLPDIAADRSVGRRTFPVVAGVQNSARVYALFNALAALTLGVGIWLQQLPPLAGAGLVPLGAAVPVTIAVQRRAVNSPQMNQALALNVSISIATPLALAAAIWWS
jgi:1,4-dihydroxy-2-naphthoate polyprenyltransferase